MEGDDVTAAIDYLQTLKTQGGKLQIGSSVGVYGIGLGGYAALDGAARYPELRAVALDSAPSSPDDLVRAATDHWTGMSSGIFQRLLQPLAHVGIRAYNLGKFPTKTSCDLAHALGGDVRGLLLAGVEGDPARQSTLDLARCLKRPPEVKKDLTLTGANLPSSTGEQEEAYDRPVIEFFDKALR
jgi:pimeloyl-ACP methyl ester carboxylesterase